MHSHISPVSVAHTYLCELCERLHKEHTTSRKQAFPPSFCLHFYVKPSSVFLSSESI